MDRILSKIFVINIILICLLNKSIGNYTQIRQSIRPNIGSNISNDRKRGDLRLSLSLRYDPKYFTSVNPVNNRHISATKLPINQSKVNNNSTFSGNNSSVNIHYYSPKIYGKKSQTNNKINSFSYFYPNSSKTSLTESISSTPFPKESRNNLHRSSSDSSKTVYSKPVPIYESDNNSKKHSVAYNYDEEFEQNKGLTYYDDSEHDVRHQLNSQTGNGVNGVNGVNQLSNNGNSNSDLSDRNNEQILGPVRTGTWLGPGIAGLIIGILPIMTLIASLIPAFISIPVVSTSPFSRRRRQISDFTQFNIISKHDMSLENPKYLSEMFCTFATNDRNSDKKLIQNIFNHIIDWTPNRWTKLLPMDALFNAIKYNICIKDVRKYLRKNSFGEKKFTKK